MPHSIFSPIFKFSALSLTLFSVYARAEEMTEVGHVNVTASQVQTKANTTENSNSYILPASQSATGLWLSDKETPQTTTAITRQRIDDQNLNNITDVLEQTNGITVQSFDRGRSGFYARGFPINKYRIDGLNVSFDNQWITGENTANMMLYDHVEAVRGATGLTNGAGDPSASINITRKHADSKTPKTVLDMGYGRWQNYEASVDHTQPLNKEGSARARFITGRQAGKNFIDQEKQSQNIFYGIIDAELSDNTEASIGASYRDNRQKSYMWGGLPLLYSDGSTVDWPQSKNNSADWSIWNSTNTEYFASLKHRFSPLWNIELKAGHARNTSDAKLVYMSGSVERNTGTLVGGDASAYRFDLTRKQNDLKIQLKGAYPAFGRIHDLVVGAELSRSHLQSYGYQSAQLPSNIYTWNGKAPEPEWTGRSQSVDRTDREYGIFAATRLNLSDRIKFIAGTRFANWKREEISYGAHQKFASGNIWLPYAGILFDLNDNHTAYASYTDIFKAQDNYTKEARILDPVRGKNFEIGLKSSYLNNRLSSQISIFKIRQDNLAREDEGNTVAGSNPPTQAYIEADGARTRGFEIEVAGRITPRWNLMLGYAHAHSEDAEGERLNSNQPERNVKLFTTYDFPNRLAGLTLGGGMNWHSGRYATIGGQRIAAGSYALFDLMARYRLNKQLSAQINIDNLFNKKYYDQFSFYNQINYGAPRNIRASVRYEF